MLHGKKVLAIIPARGGSKGIKDKNIIDLCGLPLLAYSIKAAMASEYIDDVIVSTDSSKISEVALRYGAQVPFMRPQELASDQSKTIDAILFTIEELKKMGKVYDILVLLQPTNPLRDSKDIDEALTLYDTANDESLVSVCEVSEHPILMRSIDEGGLLKSVLNVNSTIRRQDMPVYYRVNGCIYINCIAALNENTSFGDNKIPYIMKKSHSVDIDTYEDLQLAKYYIENETK